MRKSLGPYPQNEEEIKILKNKGAKAVLNLQTSDDMKNRGLHWEELKEIYDRKQIEIINFPIADQILDISTKIVVGATLLDKLIQKYDVY